MKKNINNIVISTLVFSFVLVGCSIFSNPFYVGSGDIAQARMNVILDFGNTYKTPKKYLKRRGEPFSVFSFIREEQLNQNTILLSIMPKTERISMRVEDRLGEVPRGYFPNRYIVEEGKLFLWNDSITPLQKDIIEVMSKYDILDSTDVKRELGILPIDYEDTRVIILDDRLESYNYFINMENISKFKKVVTNKPFGYYKILKINWQPR